MKKFFNFLTKHLDKISIIYYLIFAVIALIFVYWLFKNLTEGFMAGWSIF